MNPKFIAVLEKHLLMKDEKPNKTKYEEIVAILSNNIGIECDGNKIYEWVKSIVYPRISDSENLLNNMPSDHPPVGWMFTF